VFFREEINQSLTLQFAEAAGKRRAAGLPIVSLGLGEPDFDTPAEFVEAVTTVLSEGNSRYSSPNGIPNLRDKIAQKLNLDNAIPAETANIVVCAGAKPALSLALMAMLEPGDEVVLLSPSFVSFLPQVLLAEPSVTVKSVSVVAGSMSIDLEQLRTAVGPKTRAIIINTPNNPAGFALQKHELESIYKLAEEFDSYIISDEVYEKLTFSDDAHVSIGSFEETVKRVITINGFSKSHALTGWRLGYACIPSQLMSRVTKIQQHMYTNTCTFVQQAVARAWEFDCKHLSGYRDLLKARVDQITQWIDTVPGLTYIAPKSGFFAFLSIESLGVTSNEFCSGLLSETGVATTPGLAFGSDWDDHFRVSYAVSDTDLQKGLEGISTYVVSLQDKTAAIQGQQS